MRVLWISSAFYPAVRYGGNVTQAWEECRALANAGARVDVVTIDTDRAPSAGVRAVELEGISVRYYPRTIGERRGFSLPLMRAALSDASRADVVHLNNPWQLANPAAAIGARRARRPYVISLRGTFMPYALAQHRLRKGAYLRLVEQHVIRGASTILASNERERAVVERRWPLTPVAVLPPVVDVDRYSSDVSVDIRARYGIALDAPLVVFVGRNHPVKGIDLLFGGFRRVVDRYPAVRLLVAGPDERGTTNDLERLAVTSGIRANTVLAGLLSEDEKIAAYRASDVVVMPSRQEGFGQVAAEAMAVGRPVVVTTETGVAPIVDASQSGLVVDVDASAIAHAIDALLADRERRIAMGRNAAAVARDRFAPGSVARQLLALYELSIERQALHSRS